MFLQRIVLATNYYSNTMKLTKLLRFVLLIFLLYSFKENFESDPDLKSIKRVDSEDKYLADSAFASKAKVVRLETKEESFVRDIRVIATDSSNIFILDRSQSAIFNFDINGKFKNKFEVVGKGPGEYNAVIDLNIDSDKKLIYLLCDRPYKIMTFDYSFNFIEEFELNDLYYDLIKSDNSFILRRNAFLDHFESYNIEVFGSKSGLLEKKLLKNDPNSNNRAIVSELGGSSMLTESLSNLATIPNKSVIYEIANDTISPKYEFDFIKQTDSNLNQFAITNMVETENYLLFNNAHSLYLLDKKSEKLNKYEGIRNYQEYNSYLNEFYKIKGEKSKISFVLRPKRIKAVESIFLEKMESMKDTSDVNRIFLNFAKKTKIGDNPILIFYDIN